MGLKTAILKKIFTVKNAAVAHAPELTFALGTVELVATVASAIHDTNKFQDTLKKHKERMAKLDAIELAQNDGTVLDKFGKEYEDFSIRDGRIGVWFDTVRSAVKTYWVTGVLAAGTVITYACGFRVLSERLAGASAAVASLVVQNRELLERVKNNVDEKTMARINGMSEDMANIKTHVDEATGETVVDDISFDEARRETFGIWFDADHDDFVANPSTNLDTLRQKLNYVQWKIDNVTGAMTYNDILGAFGFDKDERIRSGQVMGKRHFDTPEEAAAHKADWKLDIGLNDPINKDFIDGKRATCYLIFNVDPEPVIPYVKDMKDKQDKETPVLPFNRRRFAVC